MSKQLTWKQAITKVLELSDKPLHYKEIADAIVAQGLRTSVGKKPVSIVSIALSNSFKEKKSSLPYVKVGRGTYALKGRGFHSLAKSHTKVGGVRTVSIRKPTVVSSFGMSWRRDLVTWSSTPPLLGARHVGDTIVDFCWHAAAYILLDDKESIYVGFTEGKSLGESLLKHTRDRLTAKWNRFAWFGFLPFGADGSLGALPRSYGAKRVVPALAAVLTEALSPVQNRHRDSDGDAMVEFIQMPQG